MEGLSVTNISEAYLLKLNYRSEDSLRANHEDSAFRFDLACHEETSAGWLAKLSKDTYPKVRWAVASNENCPFSVLAILAHDSDREVRLRVLRNPTLSEQVLDEWFGKGSIDRVCAAVKKERSEEALAQFAKHADPLVRIAVLNNSASSLQTRTDLSLDNDITVRLWLAEDPIILPEPAQVNLALDPELEVRLTLAKSFLNSEKVMAILAKDTNLKVQKAVKDNDCYISEG